jgi:hypothetical protein
VLIFYFDNPRFYLLLQKVNAMVLRRKLANWATAGLAGQLYSGTLFNSFDICLDIINGIQLRPNDENVRNYALNSSYTDDVTRIILFLVNGSTSWDSSWEIEHIYPQTRGQWPILNTPVLLEDIGNKTILTRKEQQYHQKGNALYDDKKHIYEQTEWNINRYFHEINVWNDETIITRRKKILDKLLLEFN